VLLPRREPDLVEEARSTTRRVARTFAIACRLLPRDLRDDVYLLYLVFRTLDDLVDFGDPDAEEHVAAVEDWCHGTAPARTRETRILAELDGRHPLPRHAVLDFCAGMRDDLELRTMFTEEDVDRYCYRVAGTVGLTMAALLGTREPADEAAASLGIAMQRTNILRDIDEDLANGRTYLARETVQRFGAPAPGRREHLMRDQIARADALYEVGCAGIPKLAHGRRAISAAAGMYREILRQIERDGYGARPGRAVVPTRRKLLVAASRVAVAAR
jgi:15-cis-phytoene synthase